MKISYYVPKGKQDRQFIIDELATARNIKDKNTRKSVEDGLKKIKNSYRDGKAYFWDDEGEDLYILEYPGKISKYYCGKDFDLEPLNLDNKRKYLLVAMDTNHCTIGILNGKRIEIFWDKDSYVPRKHNQGGQSSQRFERARSEAKKQWLKKIGRKINKIYNSIC